MSRASISLFLLKIAGTAAALHYIFNHWVDWRSLHTALRNTDSSLLALAALLTLLVRWVTAMQFRILAAPLMTAPGVGKIMQAHLISSFFATITPGELVSSGVSWHYLARDERSYALTGAMLVYLKLSGYAVILLLAGLGVMLEPRLRVLHVPSLAVLAPLLCLLGTLPFVHSPTAEKLRHGAGVVLHRLPLGRWREQARQLPDQLLALHHLPSSRLLLPVPLAFVINLIGAAGFGLILHAAGVAVPWHACLWLRAVMTVVQTIPISIAGAGVRELTLVALLGSIYGAPSAPVVVASLLMLAISLFYGFFLGGALFLLDRGRKPTR